jgi:hypothetical protein
VRQEDPLQFGMTRFGMTMRDCACGSATRGRWCGRIAILCLALLIALSPSLPAFAMTLLMAPLETSGHAAVNASTHQHGDENLASNGGASDCSTLQSIDSCMAVCCVAIVSQSLEHTRVPLARETESVLTIPSSASRIASHPPPEAIA